MKKFLLLTLLFPISILAQDLFSSLDKSEMTTSILYDRAFKFADLTDHSKKINATYFIQAYSELAQADYGNYFSQDTNFENAKSLSLKNNIVPLGIIHSEFDVIKAGLYEEGILTLGANNELVNTTNNNDLFESKSRTFATPLVQKHNGLNTTFVLKKEFLFNSTNEQFIKISADFNNGMGYQPINIDQSVTVNYTTPGEKRIDFKIYLSNGEIVQNSAYINIVPSVEDLNQRAPGDEGPITDIFATIPYQGEGESIAHIGKGLYKIYFDNVDGVFDKPIIFVDGFDPGNGRDIPLMYDLLNFGDPEQNLAELVRDEGFDLVVLDFPTHVSMSDGTTVLDGGADFIQRNAFVFIELMNTLNGLKVGDEENVVIGPSMGGLISRYGLRYMEQNAMDHETRLYMSFDAPHLGANVPIGLQYLFNYMVYGAPGITAAQPLVDGLLNSAAAKQMLVDHYLGHVDGGGIEQDPTKTLPVGAPNFRDAFQTEIDAMGFPQNTRNVAVINGAGDGTADLTGSPGMILLDDNFATSGTTSADITLRFTPDVSQSAVVADFVGFLFAVPILFFDATADSPSYSSGLDSAPGGLFEISDLNEGGDPLITDFVNALTLQVFDFIPSVSGLALETDNGEINWTHDIDIGEGDPPSSSPDNTINTTPFVNWYIPDINEPHVEITDGNVVFALAEIMPETLDNDSFEYHELRLERNPIQNEIILLSTQNIENATINIIDITGKQVLNINGINLNTRTTIPIYFSSGLYLLEIRYDSRTFRTKIIKR